MSVDVALCLNQFKNDLFAIAQTTEYLDKISCQKRSPVLIHQSRKIDILSLTFIGAVLRITP